MINTFTPWENSMVKKVAADSPELPHSVNALMNEGTLKALEITKFQDPAMCAALIEVFLQYPQDNAYLKNKATKILFSQHNKQDDPDGYFAGAETHPLLQEWVMKAAISRIMSLLETSGKKVSVAYDTDRNKHYCPVIIREFHSTLKLHCDRGAKDGKGWNPIGKVNRQFAFVLKLTDCIGGATRWYPRAWRPEDERFFNAEDNYSYDERVIAGYPEIVFEGAIGTLIIFDCTCYHAVNPVIEGHRYTIGGFIGVLEETDELIIWS